MRILAMGVIGGLTNVGMWLCGADIPLGAAVVLGVGCAVCFGIGEWGK